MKIGNKKELKSIAEEKSSYLDYKDFLKNVQLLHQRALLVYDDRC